MKIEVSNGELVDKVTILDIKLRKISDTAKLVNIRNEFELLNESMQSLGIAGDSAEYLELVEINEKLWEIEDKIRNKEFKGEFDEEFIALARSVYFANDVRSEIKKRVNIKSGSFLVEEKQYVDYKQVGKA